MTKLAEEMNKTFNAFLVAGGQDKIERHHDLLDALWENKALIIAKLRQAENQWQPIETAPKDGTHVLLYVVHPDDEYARACRSIGGWQYVESGYYIDDVHGWESQHAGEPTHWMPLTAPPSDHQ